MPKRDDIKTILVIGSGPIVIGQACEFDYSGAQACKVLKADGYRVVLVNSNPATIMTDPGLADRTYVEPITPEFVEQVIVKERPDALFAHARRPDRPQYGRRPRARRHPGQVRRGDDRLRPGRHRARRGPQALQRVHGRARHRDVEKRLRLLPGRRRGHRGRARLSCGAAPLVHARRRGRRHRARSGRAARDRGAGPGAVAGRRGARGGEHRGLEGIRDGGHARPCRQRHHRVLHRELRRHGRAHGRLHHGGPRADALGRGVPAHARGVARHPGEDRRGDGRLQRAVRRQPRQRPHDRDRDEPPRVALLGACVEGHGLPHREGGGEAGRGLHARRDRERHHERPPRRASSPPSTTAW